MATSGRIGDEPVTLSPYFLFNLVVGIFMLGIVCYFMLTPWLGIPAFQCMHKSATGVDCPSCGLTRSIWALLQGDTAKAMRIHAGGLWIGGFFAGQFLLRALGLSASYYHREFAEKTLWKIDAVLGLILVIICFGKGYSFF